MENISYYQNTFFLYDKEIPFKEGMTLYPVYMDKYLEINYALGCLKIDKEEEIEKVDVAKQVFILQMTNLQFLVEAMREVDQNGLPTEMAEIRMSQFRFLFQLCLHIDVKGYSFEYDQLGKPYITLNHEQTITSVEFDILRSLLCYQHIPDFDDAYVSPEMKRQIKMRSEIDSSKFEMPTLEKRIASYCSHFHCNKNDVFKMTVREFVLNEEMSNSINEYHLLRGAELGGMVQFKKPIQHYLYREKKDKNSDFVMDFDAFKDTLGKGGLVGIKE